MEEKKEILYDGDFYDVTEWIKRHPGGSIIEMYTQTGEDATCAIQQFHNRSTEKVGKIMKFLKRRPATEAEIKQLSKLIPEENKKLNEAFKKLHQEFQAEGLFDPNLFHVGMRAVELIFIISLGIFLLRTPNWIFQVFGIMLVGLFQGRAGWFMHEAGHNSFTGNPKFDAILQKVSIGIGLGFSGSWWKMHHGRHHAMPQRADRDLDLDFLPIMAFGKEALKGQKGNILVRNQAYFAVPIDTFIIGMYWRLFLSPRYILRKKLWSEILYIIPHFLIAIFIGIGPYLMANVFTGVYLFGNFVLNHTHLPVIDEPAHWTAYSFIHTINITSNPFIDWWMGYLNFQIEHHLFPTMPQFNHKIIAPRVKKFAEEHGFKYITLTYFGAIKVVYQKLNEVAQEIKNFDKISNPASICAPPVTRRG